MYKPALGFNKGDIRSVPTGGKKVVDIYVYCEIMCKVSINVLGSKYTKDGLEEDVKRKQLTCLSIW